MTGRASIMLRDGKPLTEMDMGFLEKLVAKKLLGKIEDTAIMAQCGKNAFSESIAAQRFPAFPACPSV